MKKSTLIVIILALLLTLTGCSSSSSSYNGGYEKWKKDNHYDRQYSNDEIHDFVNGYGNKW